MELGQLVKGDTVHEYGCPDFIEAGLAYLASRIETEAWNQTQESYDAPTGNCGGWCRTGTFEIRSYCWDEDSPRAELPNFKCGELEIKWYKYLGRGMSMNIDIDANEFFEIIDDCIESLRNLEIEPEDMA